MKDITKLLEEIPLDRLTGDDYMNKRSEIKVKSHAPAIIAVAACAAVACAGAFFFLGNKDKDNKPETDTKKTPAAVISEAESEPEQEADSAAGTEKESQPEPEQPAEKSAEYTELRALYDAGDFAKLNEEIYRVQDEKYSIDFEKARLEKVFMSGKVGTSSGDLDLWVVNYDYSYPFLRIRVAAATKDGSPLDDVITDECTFTNTDILINGNGISGYSTGYFEKYGSIGLNTILVDLDERYDAELPQSVCNITLSIDGLSNKGGINSTDERISATMSAAFTADFTNNYTVISDLNAAGSWDNKFTNDWHFAADYTVKKVSYNSNGMAITVEGYFSPEDMDQALFWSENAVAVKKRPIEGLDSSDITNNCDLSGTNAFVSMIRNDGSLEELEISDYKTADNGDGTKTIYLNMSTFGFDYIDAKGLMIGSAEIDF
ncbi:MAG: hypothetical protein IKO44_03480 [Ruminococcus sp.]|nr:hypothetical protein [Ruminococcus sp.]